MQPETTAAGRAADWTARNTPAPIRVTYRTARRWPVFLAGLGVGLVLAWAAGMTFAAWYQLEYRVVIERHYTVRPQSLQPELETVPPAKLEMDGEEPCLEQGTGCVVRDPSQDEE
jgi:hypothetical protein